MLTQWRFAPFAVLVAAYAFFSSSTPDNFGWPEALIGLCLVALVGITAAVWTLSPLTRQTLSEQVMNVCFLVMLIIPTAVGLLFRWNKLDDFIRDFVPFLYFFLPILLLPHIRTSPEPWQKGLVLALCLVGVSYSIRHFMSDQVGIAALGESVVSGDMNYFALDPAVLFSATFLLVYGLSLVDGGSFLRGSIVFALGLAPAITLMAVLLRAQILLMVASLLAYLLFAARHKFLLWILITVVAAALSFSDTVASTLSGVWGLVAAKFETVGALNARDLEAQAVLSYVWDSPSNLLFGQGWGGLIDDPAAEAVVRFTHNLQLYSLFKAGLVGLIAIGLYCSLCALHFLRILRMRGPFVFASALAIGNVMAVNFLLEGGYKILSLGLALSLLWSFELQGPALDGTRYASPQNSR